MSEEHEEIIQDKVIRAPIAKKNKVSKKILVKLIISFFLLTFIMIMMGVVAYIEATM